MDELFYYQPPRRPSWYQTVNGWIIAINILVYFAQQWYGQPHDPQTWHGELSLQGLKDGHWWQLLSFQVLHGSWLHVLVNCWLIYVIGPVIEPIMGKLRYLWFYVLCGIAGGLLQIGLALIWPKLFNYPMVGASAGVSGLVGAFATLFPTQRLTILLFFVIPIKGTAKTFLWLTIFISVVGMVFNLFNIAHAAHLGGVIGGIFLTRLFMRHRYHQA